MPFDLDAALADREPKPPFEFKFGGELYTLPGEPNMVAFAQLGSDDPSKAYDALLAIFGDDQYQRLLESDAVFGGEALGLFMKAYAEHAGMDPGELSASPQPLNRTARRSKPTSNGSTGSRSRISARPA